MNLIFRELAQNMTITLSYQLRLIALDINHNIDHFSFKICIFVVVKFCSFLLFSKLIFDYSHTRKCKMYTCHSIHLLHFLKPSHCWIHINCLFSKEFLTFSVFFRFFSKFHTHLNKFSCNISLSRIITSFNMFTVDISLLSPCIITL